MTQKFSDEELLKELAIRFQAHKDNLAVRETLISELNSVNEKLVFSERLKTNFLSNIRNEINNPVTSLLEMSKYLSRNETDTDAMKKLAALIHLEISNLDFQLKNIFYSAEIESGETVLANNTVNVGTLVSSVIDSLQSQVEKKNLDLILENSIPDNQHFITDAEKLHLVICNLLSNAIQFNRAGGKIVMKCEFSGESLSISVSDSGIGINEDDTEKIYDRFRQLEPGSAKTYGGHGLGLAVTKAMLDMMGGKISIRSTVGEGSTFTVIVPPAASTGKAAFSSAGNDLLFNDSDCEFF